MEIDLAYGKGKIVLNVPDGIRADLFAPVETGKRIDFDDFKNGFLEAGGDRLVSDETLLIVVNDGFRRTPTSRILEWLEQIDARLLDSATFLITTGVHEAPTHEHYETIFGSYYDRLRDRISYHDAHDLSSMAMIGSDCFGADVWINKALLENDWICLIGSVEPHYFAGFTGGRKSIFPGLTDFATVERNHNLAVSLDAAPLKLKGNPVAEHLDSLVMMIDMSRVFSVQTVLDVRDQIAAVFFGSDDSAFSRAAGFAERTFARQAPKRYDAVIAELLPPLDDNLYQAQKALENCQAAVKNGGTAVVVSACEGGIGSEHFWNLAENWDRERNEPKDGTYRFGSHKLSRVNAIGRRIRACVHSTLSESDVRRVFYEPLDDLQGFLISAGRSAEAYSLAIVSDAGHTVLKV